MRPTGKSPCCSGFYEAEFSRRHLLKVGGMGLLGLTMPKMLQAQAANLIAKGATQSRAKSVIFLFQFGGPSHIDMFDRKPDAPEGIRGPLKGIPTNVPGLHVCEGLPRVAKVMDKVTLIRSMHHTMKNHNSASYYALTGHRPPSDDIRLRDSLDLFPAYASVVDKLAPGDGEMPTAISYPYVIRDGSITPGQHASFLGKVHDPFLFTQDPNGRDFKLPELTLPSNVSYERLTARRELQKMIDTQARLLDFSAAARGMDAYYEKALAMLQSEKLRKAFDLSAEPEALRERYGRNTYGQSLLLARRLVEAGTKFVTVYFSSNIGGQSTTGGGWDTHGFNNTRMYPIIEKYHLPITDQTLPTFLEDMDSRGLLEDTLVVWMGEFGRTPKINANASRDHWPDCYTVLLAGAGVKRGFIYGASDKNGAYPAENPVRPDDLAATMFYALGIDPKTNVYGVGDRPLPIAEGNPVMDIFRRESPMNFSILRHPLLLVCLLYAEISAAPVIRHFAPHAVVPGRTTILTFSGSELDSASNLWTSFAGVTRRVANTNANLVSFSVRCPEDARGVQALQLVGPEGASNFQLLLVDSLPTVAHQDNHRERASALQVKPPVAVDCILKSEQIDYYTFSARAGDRYAIEVIAHGIGSQMDPVARVLNSRGEELVFCDDDSGVWNDARCEFKAPTDDTYIVAVHDIGYGGGNAFDYRLRISHDPLVWFTFPLIDPSEEGYAFEQIGAGVKPIQVGSPLNPAAGPQLTTLPQVAEVEVNDLQPTAHRLDPPVILHGRIGSGHDVDRFEFAARKDQKLIFQSQTRSLGSPCDLVLRINKPDGTRITQSDLNSASDAALTNQFSEDGMYQLEVRELSGTAPDNAPYRIQVREFQPGFTLRAEENVINLKTGETGKVKVTAVRYDYDGPIELSFDPPLRGIRLQNAVIPEKKNEVELLLNIAGDEVKTSQHLKIRGRAAEKSGDDFHTVVSTDAALRKSFPLILTPPPVLQNIFVITTR